MMGAFQVRPDAVYDFATGTRAIAFNSEDFDANSWFDISNYRYTPQCKGWYQMNYAIQYKTGLNGNSVEIQVFPKMNGSTNKHGLVEGWTTNYGNYAHISFSSILYFNGSSDYCEIMANCSLATDISNSSMWSGFLIHPVA